jgi:hypothetical protein
MLLHARPHIIGVHSRSYQSLCARRVRDKLRDSRVEKACELVKSSWMWAAFLAACVHFWRKIPYL